jgi:prepilin-type N-terminal cleavage/methylation domain-containing protein
MSTGFKQTARGRGRPRRPGAGFTLIELIAVIAIMSLMMMVAMPAFKGIGGASQLANAGRQFNNALMQARQYAVARSARVRVIVAYEETVQDTGVPDFVKKLNCSAYAIMCQDAPLTSSPNPDKSNQPNLPRGQNRWAYLQPWRYLPQGVVFDPARDIIQSAAGQIELPGTTIFWGDRETTTNHTGTTRDILPIPNDLTTTKGYNVAFVEFSPSGTPSVGGSVRLVEGHVEPDGSLVVKGRRSSTTAQGSTDPASKNCVVLKWDDIVGRVKWIQPGA